MAKINGKTALSQFKRKGDIACYVMHLAANRNVDSGDIAEATASDTRMSREFAEATAKALTAAMVKALADGNRVDTEWFAIYPTCSGRFDGPTDKFDPARHSLGLAFVPKAKLKKLLAGLEVVNTTFHVKVSLSFIRCEGQDEKNVIRLGVDCYGEGEGLNVDKDREDEYVALLDMKTRQILVKAEVKNASNGTITANFAAGSVEPGEYILAVASRNGGDESLTPFTAEKVVKVIA